MAQQQPSFCFMLLCRAIMWPMRSWVACCSSLNSSWRARQSISGKRQTPENLTNSMHPIHHRGLHGMGPPPSLWQLLRGSCRCLCCKTSLVAISAEATGATSASVLKRANTFTTTGSARGAFCLRQLWRHPLLLQYCYYYSYLVATCHAADPSFWLDGLIAQGLGALEGQGQNRRCAQASSKICEQG